MISKLLVAYDGSEKSKKALNLASEIAKNAKNPLNTTDT